jgi:aminopeptidase N
VRRPILIGALALVAVIVAALVAAAVVRGGHHETKAAPPGGPKAAVTFKPGADGVGDPYFPKAGNGGYDVGHYDLALGYEPSTHHLSGTATLTAKATQNLSRFDLDLSGMTVKAVRVNHVAAQWVRSGGELVVTPRSGLPDGQQFDVAVDYEGSPKTIVGSPVIFGLPYGWQYTKDGAFVADEPNGASTWFPANDHPTDKATFRFRITVPAGKTVMANGDLKSRTTSAGHATYDWDETSPMATYLATIDIGDWTVVRGTTPGGIRSISAYDPALKAGVQRAGVISLSNRVTDYWATTFGPYPFTSTGAIVDNVPTVGFSLETQTRPLYGFAADPNTISHELAHQWFGDSVSVQSWRDIWLNEGFATFAGNLWGEHSGLASTYAAAKGSWNQFPATDPFWDQAIADPGHDGMFSQAVYLRGGMTMALLRHRLGDPTFFKLLQTWTSQHRYGNGTTAQFMALAAQVSHQDLDGFFQTWLFARTKPAHFS